MGSVMQRFKGGNQADQSVVQQPPQIQYGQPGAPMQQQQQMPAQYGQPGVPMQQQMPPRYGPPGGQIPPGYGQSYPNAPPMQRYGSSAPIPPSSYENDAYLASMTGISPTDVGQLRMEFYNYANPRGIIDRDGFRKLYVASLLNKTWDMIEREAETAFRTFDVNQTGGLDFNEYMAACGRMLKGHHQPSMYPY